MEREEKRQHRRFRYLISARYQVKYVGLILLFMFLTATICAYTVYYAGTTLLVEKLSHIYPQGRLVALVNTVNYDMLANMLLLVPAIAFIALYLSHKIAGPAYRLERYLSDMADGKLMTHVTLRKGDELVNIAVKINDLTDSLRNTIVNQRTSLDNVVTELKVVKGLVDAKTANIGEIDENIERITKEILALERELDRFKM